MFAWVAENAATVITLAVVLLAIGSALFAIIKERKGSAGGCSGNCASCGGCCACKKKGQEP